MDRSIFFVHLGTSKTIFILRPIANIVIGTSLDTNRLEYCRNKLQLERTVHAKIGSGRVCHKGDGQRYVILILFQCSRFPIAKCARSNRRNTLLWMLLCFLAWLNYLLFSPWMTWPTKPSSARLAKKVSQLVMGGEILGLSAALGSGLSELRFRLQASNNKCWENGP